MTLFAGAPFEKRFGKKSRGFTLAALILAGFIMMFSHQDKPKNEIRILIERTPNTLDTSQAPDATAARILPLINEYHYALAPKSTRENFTLLPPDPALPPLHFEQVRDELTRATLFMGNRADVLFDSLSLSKTNLLKKRGYRELEAPGFTLSFLGFQLTDSILKNFDVRKAISLSLPIRDWAHYKLFDWVTLTSVTPSLPDLDLANQLLDQAHFPKNADGIRFSLSYVTTPVREGHEMALLTREALKAIGIEVNVTTIETSLFYQRLKKGDFQLFAGRILRNTNSDPVSDFVSKAGVRNYFHYDGISDSNATWDEVKQKIASDLPFVPLFTWNHGVVFSERVEVPNETASALDDSFRFLRFLRLKSKVP